MHSNFFFFFYLWHTGLGTLGIGGGGGGGGQHISTSFTQEWIFNYIVYFLETPKFVVTTKCFYCIYFVVCSDKT